MGHQPDIPPTGWWGRMSRRLPTQFVEQRLCVFEVGGVEAFGEPVVDRREQVLRFGVATLVAAEPSEARGGAQFPEFGLLLSGNAQSFLTELLGCLGMPLPQQQLASVPIQLRREPPFSCPIHHLQPLVQQAQGLFNLPCDRTCAGQESAEFGHPCLGLGGAESAFKPCRSRDIPCATSSFCTFAHPISEPKTLNTAPLTVHRLARVGPRISWEVTDS